MITVSSPFAQLYVALQQYLKTEVPDIRHIDLELGQLDYYHTRPAVSFPCLFIDFPNTGYEGEGDNVQWADITIVMRLGLDPFSSASSITPDASIEKSLGFFELENQLVAALQGYAPEYNEEEICQPLIRISAGTEVRQDPFRVRKITFTTGGEDVVAQPQTTKVSARLNITT